MVDIHAISAEKVTHWVSTWASRDWPMGIKSALELCGELGWTPLADRPYVFSVGMDENNHGDVALSYRPEGDDGIDGWWLFATTRIPNAEWFVHVGFLDKIYQEYVSNFAKLWGFATMTEGDRGRRNAIWILPNRLTVGIVRNCNSVQIYMDSPYVTHLTEMDPFWEEELRNIFQIAAGKKLANDYWRIWRKLSPEKKIAIIKQIGDSLILPQDELNSIFGRMESDSAD